MHNESNSTSDTPATRASDQHKQKQLVNYLHADTAADDWYNSLDAVIRADWALVAEATFHVRWPKAVVVKRASAEYEELLRLL